MKRQLARAIAAVLILLLTGYFSVYAALLRPLEEFEMYGDQMADRPSQRFPVFRYQGRIISDHHVFDPLIWLDHQIRPAYWEPAKFEKP